MEFYVLSWQVIGYISIFANFLSICLVYANFAKEADFLVTALNSQAFHLKHRTYCFFPMVTTKCIFNVTRFSYQLLYLCI